MGDALYRHGTTRCAFRDQRRIGQVLYCLGWLKGASLAMSSLKSFPSETPLPRRASGSLVNARVRDLNECSLSTRPATRASSSEHRAGNTVLRESLGQDLDRDLFVRGSVQCGEYLTVPTLAQLARISYRPQ